MSIPYKMREEDIYEYDLFISSAEEDFEVVQNLMEELKKHDLKLWQIEESTTLGDNLIDAVNKAMQNSKYGVVLISPDYMKDHAVKANLYSFMRLEFSKKKKRIIPIWHNLNREIVEKEFNDLSYRKYTETNKGIKRVAQEILKAIKSPFSPPSLPTRYNISFEYLQSLEPEVIIQKTQQLNELKKIKVEDAENHYKSGHYYLHLRQYTKAIEQFKKACELEEFQPSYHYSLALALLRGEATLKISTVTFRKIEELMLKAEPALKSSKNNEQHLGEVKECEPKALHFHVLAYYLWEEYISYFGLNTSFKQAGQILIQAEELPVNEDELKRLKHHLVLSPDFKTKKYILSLLQKQTT